MRRTLIRIATRLGYLSAKREVSRRPERYSQAISVPEPVEEASPGRSDWTQIDAYLPVSRRSLLRESEYK